MRAIAWVAILALGVCAGCARTWVDSKTVGTASSQIDRIALVFHFAQQFTPDKRNSSGLGSAYSSININKAFENQSLVTRTVRSQFPVVFRKHGIELEVYMDPSDRDRFALDGEKQRHVLHLTPVAANYHSYGGGTTLFMNAQLTELRPTRVLWKGEISIFRPGIIATIDDDFANAFAEKIVSHLKQDGILGKPVASIPTAPADPVAGDDGFSTAREDQPVKAAPPPVEKSATLSRPAKAPDASTAVEDVDAVPALDERGRLGYQTWLSKSPPRAFVIAENGHWSSSWGRRTKSWDEPSDPAERAMANCQKRGHKECKLYAVDYQVVWTAQK